MIYVFKDFHQNCSVCVWLYRGGGLVAPQNALPTRGDDFVKTTACQTRKAEGNQVSSKYGRQSNLN